MSKQIIWQGCNNQKYTYFALLQLASSIDMLMGKAFLVTPA